jgi:post-segregation antitoxin (ccd killing protein)
MAADSTLSASRLTLKVPPGLKVELARRARAKGLNMSALARSTLIAALSEPPTTDAAALARPPERQP